MFTNRVRFTGFSGIDVADMVNQIMRAESVRLDRLRQNRDILAWQQQQMRAVATDINQFRNRSFSFVGSQQHNILNSQNWRGTTPTVTMGGAANSAISVTTTENAAVGNHSLEVFRIAQTDGIRSVDGTNHNASAGATSSGINLNRFVTFDEDGNHTISGGNINVTVNGVTRNIEFTPQQIESMISPEIIANLQNVWNQVETRWADDNVAREAFIAHALAEAGDAAPAPGTPEYDEFMNRLQDEFRLESIQHFQPQFIAAGANFMPEFANALNARLGTYFGNNVDGTQRATATFSGGQITFSASPGNTASIQAGTGAGAITMANLGFTGSTTTTLDLSGRLDSFLGDSAFVNDTTTIVINGVTIEATRDESIQTLITRINNSAAGVTMRFENLSGQFIMESDNMGEHHQINLAGNTAGGFIDQAFGSTVVADLRFRTGQSAAFSLNGGAILSRETNNFTIDGLNINLTQAATTGIAPNAPLVLGQGNTFHIEVSADTSGVRDMILDFVDQFNTIIRNIRELTETRRPRVSGSNGRDFFMPLTEDQRRAMSESEIRQWEEQAQTGLLNRDPALRALTQDLRNAIFQNVVTADGSIMNLLHIGISSTNDMLDPGVLVIDEAVLDAALANNFENVRELFTQAGPGGTATRPEQISGSGVAVRINNVMLWTTSIGGAIFQRSGTTESLASHNDNFFTNRINEQETRIEAMIARLARRENTLFAQFSRMEMAMMRAESQMSFMEQLIWGNM